MVLARFVLRCPTGLVALTTAKGVKADMVSRLCIAMCKDGPVTAAKLASEDAH
jgi:hypothetical protein